MANPTRIRTWSFEFRNSSVMMQGTQRTYDPHLGEKSLTHWETDHHDIIEARVQKKKGLGSQPEGVLIMVPKGMLKIARRGSTPTNQEYEGKPL